MSTKWACDICKREGSVRHGKHADVWTVAQKIFDSHRTISPACQGGRDPGDPEAVPKTAEPGGERGMKKKAEQAVREAEAQLRIVQVLARLSPARRERVAQTAWHLIEADALIPGIFECFLRGAQAVEGEPEASAG